MELDQNKNKFITGLSEFLKHTGPEVLGCFWITEQPLSKREKPFAWFNYLFNGVFESQVCQFPASEKSFYFTEQFGKKFHLMAVESTYAQMDKAYEEFLSMIPAEKGEVLLLGTKEQIFTKKMIKGKNNYLYSSCSLLI